jgi:putative NADH-flavin reductase
MRFRLFRRRWLISLAVALGACSDQPDYVEAPVEMIPESERQTIVVFGASGRIGGIVVNEALGRGHRVIGISRSPERFTIDHESFSARKGDVTDVQSFREVTTGADAIIISVQESYENKTPETTVQAIAASTAVAALSDIKNAPYVLHFGGATSMYETKEAMLEHLESPAPEGSENFAKFFGHLVALQTFRASNIDWTVLTPPFGIKGWSSRGINDTTRTGNYRTSTTELISDEDGEHADILVADLAVAAVDEVENRQFVRQRFTAAN